MCDPKSLINKFASSTETSTRIFNGQWLGFAVALRKTGVVRIFMEDSPNYGHYASTKHILHVLASKLLNGGELELYYEVKGTPVEIVKNKLRQLIPGFNPAGGEEMVVEHCFGSKCTLICRQWNPASPPPLPPVKFAFCGGCDRYKLIPLDQLNAEFFLICQPYQWHVPSIIKKLGQPPVELDELATIGDTSYPHGLFFGLPYLFECKEYDIPIGSEAWSKSIEFASAPESASIAKITILNSLESNFKIWPMYGFNVFCEPGYVASGFGSPIKDILFRSLFPLFQMMANETSVRTIIVPVISPEMASSCFDLINAFIGTDEQWTEYLDSAVPSFTKYKGILGEMRIRFKPFFECVCLLDLACSPDDAGKALQKMASLANAIVVMPVTSVPQTVFNYLFSHAGFPPLFEGQCTSSLALSIGKPFFQFTMASVVPSEGKVVPVSDYPVFPVFEAISDAFENIAKFFVINWSTANPDWFNQLYASASSILSNPDIEKSIALYFTEIKKWITEPQTDKLKVALCMLNAISPPPPKETNPETLLGNVKLRLLEAAELGNAFDLYPCVEGTGFQRFFTCLAEKEFPVSIKPEDIREVREKGKLTAVRVTNSKARLFGEEFNMELTCSEFMASDNLCVDISCSRQGNCTLPGLSWLDCESFGFVMRTMERGIPVTGAMTLRLKETPLTLNLAYPWDGEIWQWEGTFDTPRFKLESFFKLAGGFNFFALFPESLRQLTQLGVKDFGFVYDSTARKLLSMRIGIESAEEWHVPGLENFGFLPRIGVTISPFGPFTRDSLSLEISGTMRLGKAKLFISGRFPSFQLTISLVENTLGLSDLASVLDPSLKIEDPFEISALNLAVAPEDHWYSASCAIETDWSVGSLFTIRELAFSAEKRGEEKSFFIGGKTVILPESLKCELTVTAAYCSGGGWTIEGVLSTGETPALSSLLNHYLGEGTGELEDAPDFPVSELSLHVESKTGDWRFRGETGKKEPWKVKFLGDREVSASVELGTRPARENTHGDAASPFYARVEAAVAWNNISLEAWCRYQKTEEGRTSWQFGFTWDALTAEVTKEAVSGHWIGSLSLAPGTTFGDLIEHMVSWLKGESYGLPAPWDALHRLKCDGLGLEYNFTTGDVGLQLSAGKLDLGFVTIEGITLTYGEKAQEGGGKKKGVWIELDARFAWQEKTGPLAWDASDPDAAPAIDGTGGKYFRLDMLAIGQHIEVEGLQEAHTVQKAVELLTNMPEPEPGALPPVRYAPGGNWMFGTEFGVIKLSEEEIRTAHQAYMLRCRAVLNDPGFYALQITAEGNAAKIFKGLDIEVLYRKVSDTIGVFESQITLPDRMRYFTVGAYSLTMPVLGFSLYTNGDYKVDIGFPWKGDFSRSLSVEGILAPGIPVTGSAGLYFGQLTSATAGDLVPVTDAGLFQPVITFGFGIRLGIGKSVNYGVLKAGFSFTFMVILEGVLARWHPYPHSRKGTRALRKSDSGSIDGDYYYKLAATAGISGRLYGSIDFCIIKAEVSIAIDVSVLICLESCRPVIFTICASVSVEAKLTLNLGIFSISIHFGFSLSIKETFRIGESTPAPWDVPRRGVGIIGGPLERRLRTALIAESPPDWTVRLPGEKRPLKGCLAAATVLASSGDVAGEDLPHAMRQAGGQTVSLVVSLLLDTVVPASQDRENAILKAQGKERDSSFETLCKTIAAWVVAAVRKNSPGFVTRASLRRLIEQDLVATDENPLPIPVDAIEAFFNNHFECSVSSTLEGCADAGETPPGACFPMPGAIRFSIYGKTGGQPCREYDLDQYNKISNRGLREIRKIFDELAVRVQEEDREKRLFSETDSLSVATWLFSDVILLLARQMAQAMDDRLRCFNYPLRQGETLENILDWIKENTDPAEDPSVCSLSDLLIANASHILTRGKTLILPDGSACTVENENMALETLAAEHRIPVQDLALNPANGKITDLFDRESRDVIDIPHLHNLSLDEVLKAVQRSRQLQHLSGMLSRFLLHGLRLPADSLDSSSVELPPEAGLYTLTGQQVPLPADPDGFSVKLQSKTSWLRFDGKKDEAVLKLDGNDRLRIESIKLAAQNGNWLSQPAIQPASQIVRKPAVFSLSNPENCLLGTENAAVWTPSGVIPGVTEGKAVKYNVYSGRYDEAAGRMQSREEHDFFWATRLRFLVRKLDAATAPGRRTFELAGMNASDTALLESVIAANMDAGISIRIGFVSLDAGSTLSIPMDEDMTFGIVRSNLSTVTNPGNQAARSLPEKRNVPMRDDFCRLLWEASVTNSGGYYLYYDANGEGLPDSIFDEKGRAELTLLLIPKEEKLFSFTNALLFTSYLEKSGILYARAVKEGNAPVPEEISLPPQPGIARIAWNRAVPGEPSSLPGEKDTGEWGGRYLANLYQMAAIRIESGSGFLESRFGIPIGPSSPGPDTPTPVCWEYERSICAINLLEGTTSRNPYAAVGRTLSMQGRWHDVYGNCLDLPPSRTAMKFGYNDTLIGLSSWPGATGTWNIAPSANGRKELFCFLLRVSFDASRYQTDPDQAENCLASYRQIQFQLDDPNGVRHEILFSLLGETPLLPDSGKLREWVSLIIRSLEETIRSGACFSYPDDFCWAIETDASEICSEPLMELSCRWRVKREKASFISPEARGIDGILQTETALAPDTCAPQNSEAPISLKKFAADFEAILPEIRLMNGKNGGTGSLWACRQSGKGSVSWQVNPSLRLYAVRPLSNRLLSLEEPVKIPVYMTGEGIKPQTDHEKWVKGIDLDQWMKIFLESFDGILGEHSIGAIGLLDSIGREGKGSFLDELLGIKQSIAESLCELLCPVYEGKTPPPGDRTRNVLKQELLVKLSSLDRVHAVAEYPVTVEGGIDEGSVPPRFDIAFTLESNDPENLNAAIQLGHAKISLRSHDETTMAFAVKAPPIVKNANGDILDKIKGKLVMNPGMLERGIHLVKGVEPYESSEWLGFITSQDGAERRNDPLKQSPPCSSCLGEMTIPFPIREYPDLPSLLEQKEENSGQTNAGEELFHWNYGFTYSLPCHYPQDELTCVISCCETVALGEKRAPEESLVSDLAVFTELAAAVQNDWETSILGLTPENTSGADNARAALGACIQLAGNISQSLRETLKRGPSAKQSDNESYRFVIRESMERLKHTDESEQDAFTVSLWGPPPPWDTNLQVLIQPETCALRELPRPWPEGCIGHWAYIDRETGTYLSPREGQTLPERSVRWNNLNLIKTENVRAGLLIRRNAYLSETETTAAPFIYTTGDIKFDSPCLVSRDLNDTIDITDKTGGVLGIGQYMKNFMTFIFNGMETETVKIQIEASCLRPFHPGMPDVELPIFLQLPADCPLNDSSLTELTSSWEEKFEQFRKTSLKTASGETKPWDAGSRLRMDLIIYTRHTTSPKVLLRFRRLEIPAEKIAPVSVEDSEVR